jgi:CheY-like chemotaxis protein
MKREPSHSRWMLVDDDDNLRETIAKLIAALIGVEVVGFSTGSAALSAYAAAPDRFDFVVSDLDMPEMSGIEFCRRIHQIQPQLKVLLATGSGVITAAEALDYGFCGLVSKPLSVASLRSALSRAIAPSEG